MQILRTLRHIYWDSTRPTRVLTLFMYPLAMLGLYLAWDKGAQDMQWMFHTLPCPEYCHALLWGLLIAHVTVARFVGLFVFEGWRWTRRTTPMIGIAFWSSLLASNLHSPDTLAFGTLYGVAALLETWILSRAWLETA